ncbi:AI-2E family transporter [Microbacteriaceae bacterium VKM Ac-2854]|nr:AI-2E family transporter [Microbacteriaceae bacterium VKM Ac-2854]
MTPTRSVDGAVTPGIRIAAAWSWRFLAVVGVLALVCWLVSLVPVAVIPVMVALLLSALLTPLRAFLQRHRWPKWAAVLVSLLALLIAVGGLITLVVMQTRSGFSGLREQSVTAAEGFEAWIAAPPFNVTDVQLSDWLDKGLTAAQAQAGAIASGALKAGSVIAEVFTGTLLTLFTLLFFLLDGRAIWNWIVRLFPRNARAALDVAAQSGWRTLSLFVRAQLAVAGINAVGIGIGAFALQLPLALPIAVVVFLGSFIPIVGAIATGAVAVVIALVYNGWVVALIMLAIVIVVHQVEGHVLQPLILGSAVEVHPLAVVLGVAAGLEIAGIAGALFAVPLIATANAMITAAARHHRAPE